MASKRLLGRAWRHLDSDIGQRLLKGALGQAGEAARDVYRLAGNRRVRLAVTGLSRSGKSVFITSLVNQLLETSAVDPTRPHRLPRVRAVQQGRYLGAQPSAQPDSTAPSFRYDTYRRLLLADPPQWPAGTTDISQIRLHLRSRPDGLIGGLLSEHQDLYLDITDYPGEWLVDLPLLATDFDSWSRAAWAQAEKPHLAALSAPWRERMRELRHGREPGDGETLAQAHALFRDYLAAAKAAGYNFLQPGRLLLPGHLDGAPAVTFCPCLSPDEPSAGSLYGRLRERFAMYQRDVVRPFFSRHFARFDCQVVLTDLMYALEQGPAHFDDTRQTLNTLLQSFSHGRSSLINRLFSPRIDRILFAATKVDQVNRALYPNLQRLLEAMLRDTWRAAEFNAVRHLTLALASVKATETVLEPHAGGEREFVRGRLLALPPDAPPKELYYPPDAVPSTLPDEESWREQPFHFHAFHPPRLAGRPASLPHVNMDAAIEFLFGDRL